MLFDKIRLIDTKKLQKLLIFCRHLLAITKFLWYYQYIMNLSKNVILRRYIAEYDYRQYFLDVVLRCVAVFVFSYLMALLLHSIFGYDGFWLFLVECMSIAVATGIVIFILGLKSQERRMVTVKLLDRINHLLRNRI